VHPVFSVDADDISKLNDEQARELIARLCRLELKKNGVSASCVQWGGDQRAKDGGVDVFVEVEPRRALAGYVKADRTAFQVKAEQFGPARIPGEMAPRPARLRSPIGFHDAGSSIQTFRPTAKCHLWTGLGCSDQL